MMIIYIHEKITLLKGEKQAINLNIYYKQKIYLENIVYPHLQYITICLKL